MANFSGAIHLREILNAFTADRDKIMDHADEIEHTNLILSCSTQWNTSQFLEHLWVNCQYLPGHHLCWAKILNVNQWNLSWTDKSHAELYFIEKCSRSTTLKLPHRTKCHVIYPQKAVQGTFENIAICTQVQKVHIGSTVHVHVKTVSEQGRYASKRGNTVHTNKYTWQFAAAGFTSSLTL